MITRTYQLHGTPVHVSGSEQRLLDAVHARLRRFSTHARHPAGIAIEIHDHASSEALSMRPAGDGARPVYDPPLGVVRYAEREDRLRISYGAIEAECDARAGRARIAIGGGSESERWAATHPILTLCLVEMLRRRGLFSLHAAALALDGHGVVIAGNSGAGKSTLTLALLRAGYALLGDDTSFLAPAPNPLRVLGFPDEIGVTDRTIQFFPELAPLLRRERTPGAPKHQLLAEQVYDASFAGEAVPSLLILPRVSGEPVTRVTEISSSEALLELVPNVLLTDPDASREHLAALGSLVSSAHCVRMATGRDLDAIPARVAALLGARLPRRTTGVRLAAS